MAFYRTLIVNKTKYQYHIGETYVKIKGSGNILKKDIFDNPYGICTPGMIKNYILGITNKVEDFYSSCGCKNVKKALRILPFEYEILETKSFAYICQDCYDANADDI